LNQRQRCALPLNQKQRTELSSGRTGHRPVFRALAEESRCENLKVTSTGSLESEPDWRFAGDDGILACGKRARSCQKTTSALARLVFRELSGFHSRPIALRSLRSQA